MRKILVLSLALFAVIGWWKALAASLPPPHRCPSARPCATGPAVPAEPSWIVVLDRSVPVHPAPARSGARPHTLAAVEYACREYWYGFYERGRAETDALVARLLSCTERALDRRLPVEARVKAIDEGTRIYFPTGGVTASWLESIYLQAEDLRDEMILSGDAPRNEVAAARATTLLREERDPERALRWLRFLDGRMPSDEFHQAWDRHLLALLDSERADIRYAAAEFFPSTPEMGDRLLALLLDPAHPEEAADLVASGGGSEWIDLCFEVHASTRSIEVVRALANTFARGVWDRDDLGDARHSRLIGILESYAHHPDLEIRHTARYGLREWEECQDDAESGP